MSQTALEWLIEQVNSDCLNSTFISQELIIKAKAMEKEQIVNAYILPLSSQYWFKDEDFFQTEAEQYYNETYEQWKILQ